MGPLKYPLLEVIEAIQQLKESKGPTEAEVCEYVRNCGRDPNNPMKVLKTIRTLNKLCSDGVLTKNGKRYSFASGCPRNTDDDDEDNEEDEEDDDEDEDDQDEMEEDEEEEEEDDDDDDDDDDDEEEDEDDDDECDEGAEEVPGEGAENEGDNDEDDCNDEEKDDKDEKKQNGDDDCDEGANGQKSTTNGNNGNGEGDPAKSANSNAVKSETVNEKKSSRVPSKGKSCDGNNKGGEAFAFCVRDFMDARSKRCNKNQKKPTNSVVVLEHLDAYESSEVRKLFQQKRSRPKKDICSRSTYRSRSPIKIPRTELFSNLKRDRSDDLCLKTVSSAFLHELIVAEMEVDDEGEIVGIDTDSFRHKSPPAPLSSTNPPGPLIKKIESSISLKKPEIICEEIKEHTLKNTLQPQINLLDNRENLQMNWIPVEADKNERSERSMSSENGANSNEEEHTSLCSVCDKKKINNS